MYYIFYKHIGRKEFKLSVTSCPNLADGDRKLWAGPAERRRTWSLDFDRGSGGRDEFANFTRQLPGSFRSFIRGALCKSHVVWSWTSLRQCERCHPLELLGGTRKRKRNNNEEAMVHFTIFIFRSVASIRVTLSGNLDQCFVRILTGTLDVFGGGRRLTSRGTWAIDSVVGSVRWSIPGGTARDGGSGETDTGSSTLRAKSLWCKVFTTLNWRLLRVLIWASMIVIRNWRDVREKELA